ncbi:trk system potassium uptake protein TrkH [Rhodobacteraceae bacterium MBR-64]
MIDQRPIGYVTGLLVCILGLAMLVPMVLDYRNGDPNWTAFLESSIISVVTGGLVALACRNRVGEGLSIQQSFLLTTGLWAVLPLFGALPFMIGAPDVGLTDAYFEAMSGLTTTGATVFHELQNLPLGTNLWRGILQWLGGLGIVIVAMVFLPVMKVGGMQYFRSEGFDTLGKILPRALDIATGLIRIYLGLTVLCLLAYAIVGMAPYDAVVHALTTMSTGGFSTTDSSFAKYAGPAEYVSAVFMIAASVPFVRFVQLMAGSALPMYRDLQVRAYLRWMLYAIAAIVAYRMFHFGTDFLPALRETTFNVVSIMSGTGYGSEDITSWGPFPFVVFLIIGIIGGCTSSTGCSIKVFRYLVLIEAIKMQIRRIYTPSRVSPMKLGNRVLEEDVVNSVIVLFTMFILTFGITSVLLSLTGLQTGTALTAAWTSIFNIGPAFGPEVRGSGAMDQFPVAAKWIMAGAMMLGRLELLSVFVLVLPRFWRG